MQHRIRIREFHIADVGHAHAAANRELDAVGTTGNERTVHSHFRAVSLQSPVDSALSVGTWKPSSELLLALDCLPERLGFLAVVDHRDSAMPEAIAGLPAYVQTLAAIFALEDAPVDATGSSILSLVGIPRPGGFRIRVPPSNIPRAEQLRSYLFPSVIATTVDERGFRLLAREAFPFVCLGSAGNPKLTFKF